MIKTIIFDINGTLLNTEFAVLSSLADTILEVKNERIELPDLKFALGIPGEVTLLQLGVDNVASANNIWKKHMSRYASEIKLFDGVRCTLDELKLHGYKLGVITSKTKDEYKNDFSPLGLDDYFDTIICAGDTSRPKPFPDPMLKFMEMSGAKTEEIVYIGDTIYDMLCASDAGVKFGVALWGCHSLKNMNAHYYFNLPKDIPYVLSIGNKTPNELKWVKLAMELQFLAQGGITYSKDVFDIERFERIREISAEMISLGSGYSIDYVKDIFCNETGFQTPKLDTRAAIFQDNKILLVQERDGRWALPGGWVDVNESIKSNTVKEVKEEAGLNVIPIKLIAVQDRNLHNTPRYAYGIIKTFVLCEVIGGEFTSNVETTGSLYFNLTELPPLAEDKNTKEQIKMCFDAYYAENWETILD